MLELKNYEGCGNCEKCGCDFDCKAHTLPVIISFNKTVKWDNWGQLVTAFRKGEKVQGYAVIDDNKVYCASAESTIYSGVEDFIDMGCIAIEIIN